MKQILTALCLLATFTATAQQTEIDRHLYTEAGAGIGKACNIGPVYSLYVGGSFRWSNWFLTHHGLEVSKVAPTAQAKQPGVNYNVVMLVPIAITLQTDNSGLRPTLNLATGYTLTTGNSGMVEAGIGVAYEKLYLSLNYRSYQVPEITPINSGLYLRLTAIPF